MKIVGSNEFKNEISEGVVLVDFFATWCGPCKMLAPVLENLNDELNGKAKIVKVDIDECSDLANEFKIVSVPTMILFKNGEPVDSMVGFLPKEKIQQVIENNL